FEGIRARRAFVSAPNAIDDEAYIKAAFSKCVDFNIIVNRKRNDWDESFLLLSGLRGIAEELIALKYSLKFSPVARAEYFNCLSDLNRCEGILAQKLFFEANNPFQLVVD